MEVRELKTLEEIEGAVAFLGRVDSAPVRDQIPPNLFRAMTWRGNMLLGGFVGEALAGISFGFWGRDDDGRIWLCSAKTTVAPEHDDTGVLEELKAAAARWAAARGIHEVREA